MRLLLLLVVCVSGCSGRNYEKVPFLPSDISGLIRWGKADALSLNNDDPVDSYTDQSGAGNHFVASSTTRPLFKTNVQNGLAAILFDGSNDYLTRDALGTTFSGSATPFTFFWAGKHSALTNAPQCFFIAANITGSATPTHDLFFAEERYTWWSDRRNDAATITRLQAFEPDTNWHTLVYVYDGTNAYLYADGHLATSAPLPTGAMTVNAFTYGAHRRSDGITAPFNGYWGEDGIYDSALNSIQVADLHGYLKSRWNTAATPAWAPSDLGDTLKSWATPKTWKFLANNAAVGTWYSRVSKGSTSQVLSASGTYKTASVAGKDAVLLGGTNQIADNTLATYASGTSKTWTVFGVFQPTVVANDGHIFGFGGASSTPLHRIQMSTAATYRIDRRNDSNTLSTAQAGTPNTTSPHSFVYSYDGSTGTLVIDGTTIVNGASLGTGSCTLTTFQLGSFRSTERMTGYFVECGLTDTATTGADLTNLVNYLEGVAGRPVATGNRRRRVLLGMSP